MSKYLLTPVLAFLLVITSVFVLSENLSKVEIKKADAAYFTTSPYPNHQDVSNPSCFDNYMTWNNSATFNANSNWSTAFLPPLKVGEFGHQQTESYNQFLDVNGDGLNDFLFRQATFIPLNNGKYANVGFDCLYLNKGNGWEKAYRCVTNQDAVGARYYGDCAG